MELDDVRLSELLAELVPTFLVTRRLSGRGAVLTLDWVHAVYREFAIDMLSANAEQCCRFVHNASREGLGVALIRSRNPQVTLPFIQSSEAWVALREAVLRLAIPATVGGDVLRLLLEAHRECSENPDRQQRLRNAVESLVDRIDEEWVDEQPSTEALYALRDACRLLEREVRVPGLENSWRVMQHDIIIVLDRGVDDDQYVSDWIAMVGFIAEHSPVLLDAGWFGDYRLAVELLVRVLDARLFGGGEGSAPPSYLLSELSDFLGNLPGASDLDLDPELIERIAAECDRLSGAEVRDWFDSTRSFEKGEGRRVPIEKLFEDL